MNSTINETCLQFTDQHTLKYILNRCSAQQYNKWLHLHSIIKVVSLNLQLIFNFVGYSIQFTLYSLAGIRSNGIYHLFIYWQNVSEKVPYCWICVELFLFFYSIFYYKINHFCFQLTCKFKNYPVMLHTLSSHNG